MATLHMGTLPESPEEKKNIFRRAWDAVVERFKKTFNMGEYKPASLDVPGVAGEKAKTKLPAGAIAALTIASITILAAAAAAAAVFAFPAVAAFLTSITIAGFSLAGLSTPIVAAAAAALPAAVGLIAGAVTAIGFGIKHLVQKHTSEEPAPKRPGSDFVPQCDGSHLPQQGHEAATVYAPVLSDSARARNEATHPPADTNSFNPNP